MKKLITFLMLLSVFGIGNVWADTVQELHLDNGVTQSGTYFTVAKTSGSPSYNEGYTGKYEGTTYAKGLKMEDGTTITFTTEASSSTVIIVQATKKSGGGSNNGIKFDDTNYSYTDAVTLENDANNENVRVYTISNVSNATHTISRNSESGIFYVKVIESSAETLTTVGIPTTWTFTSANNIMGTSPLDATTIKSNMEFIAISGTKIYQNSDNINLGGGAAYLHFKAPANCTVKVNAYNPNTSANRYLHISTGSKNTSNDLLNELLTGTATDYVVSLTEATDVYVYCSGGGINIASVAVEAPVVVTTPTINVAAQDGETPVTATEGRGQVYTGHTITLSSLFNNGAIDASKFDVVYTITNEKNYANAATINGDQLKVGHAAGRFYVTATATSKSILYNDCSTTVEFEVNNSAGDGSNQDVFAVSDFGYANGTNGTNSSNNQLDRTLKGFSFVFTEGEAAKYNNNNYMMLRRSGDNYGKLAINEDNQGKCEITKVEITYRSSADATLTTNAITDAGGESLFLPSTNNADQTVTMALGRSFFTMQMASDASVLIKSIKLYYQSSTLDHTLVTPTLTFNPASLTAAPGSAISEPTLTTSPKTLAVTYSSSDPAVATVDATTGEVTAVAAGTATITATYAGTTTLLNAASGSYTLTVASIPEAVTFSPNSGEVTSGTTVTLTTSTAGATIYYTTDGTEPTTSSTQYNGPITITAATTIRAIANNTAGSSSISNATYTIASAADELQTISEHDWTFDSEAFDKDAAYGYTLVDGNTFEIFGSKSGKENNFQRSSTAISTSGENPESFYNYLKFENSTYNATDFENKTLSDANRRYFHFKVNAVANKTKVKVYGSTGSNGSSRSGNIAVGEFNNVVATLTNSNSKEAVTVEYTFTEDGVKDVWVYSPSSAFQFYKILVSSNKTELTTFRSMGGQTYSYAKSPSATKIDGYIIYFQPAGAITDADLTKITVTSSDNSVLDVSSISKSINTTKSWIVLDNILLGEGGTATLNVAFEGNSGYKPASTTTPTFIVMAPGPYQVAMSDVQIQAGNRGVMEPIITDKNGTAIKITDSGVSRLDDEDESFDYTEYFDFKFSCPENNDGVSMPSAKDPTVVTTANIVSEGNGVVIGVTATPKPAYTSLFTNSTASTQATVKVVNKQGSPQINFWKDAAMKQAPVKDTDYTLEGSTSVFEDIKNGRLFYMSPKNEGDEIWFTYSVGSEAPDVYRPSDGKPVKKSGKGLYQYRNGFPVHIDDATTGTVYANFLAFTPVMDSSGKITYIDNGSPVKAKFIITADGPRPDVLTYSPATTDADPTVRNTSISVTANGTPSTGNKVYAKFSSEGTSYTTEQLINEAHVISGIETTGVFSTEVNKRKITGVQIYHNSGDGYDYVSNQSDDIYYYKYATTLTFNTETEYANVNQEAKIQHVVTSAKYYNKDEKVSIEELTAGSVTYAFEGTAPTGTTINSSTGEVTIGSAAGRVVVVATYHNPDDYTVNGRSSQMSDATAKYTIVISDPNKYLPVITPNAQNFSTTLSVNVKADNTTNKNAYYLVVTEDGTTPTAEDIVSKGTKVVAGNNSSFTISESCTVYAVTYDNATDTEHPTYSSIVSETYKKVEPIPAPTFNPDGTISGGYNYVTPTLKVEAFTQTEGAQVYYTLNGQDPVIGSDYTYVYDGLAGIQVGDDATTTIKAIAVKDGIESNVTTSVYHHTNIAQPTIKVNGTEQADNSSVAITSTTPITISNPTTVPTGYTATIYYTLDGSEPSVDNGIIYTGEFTSPKATTLKAITVFTDESGNILSSEAKTVTLTMSSTNKNLWEAIESTTPGGKLDKNNRTITSVDDITATFGGADNTDFNNYTIDDTSLGTPLDGVGEYSIRSSNDALDETGIMYTHTSSLDSYCETVHEKTFKIPAKGDFVRFEPTKDGNLTIWALQQGAVHFDQDATFCDQFIRRRPVYLVDEQGKSIEASEIESSARLSTKWTTLINNVAAKGQNAFVGLNGKQNGVTNNLYTQEESYAIYNMYINYLTKNGVGIGDPIKPFAIHNGTNTISEQGGNLPDNSNDQTGYVLASGGYVKYVFPVKAGKSYYFFGHRTKVGIRGFQFIATENVSARPTVEINADVAAVQDIVTGNTGKTVNVTLNRNFKANTWTTLVLPFSVSETALQTAFGYGDKRVDLIHFDNITGTDNNTISMKRHWYKMIVAGTPVMIYPRKAVTSVTFNGVQIEANTIDNITGECDDYTMMGTFSYLTGGLLTNDYYMNTSGNFRRFTGTTAAMKATRAWLRPKDTNNAKSLMVSFEDIFSGDDTTGIISIEDGLNENNNSAADDVIYNLQGQKVGKGNTSNLPQGVYIKNGKKIVVE